MGRHSRPTHTLRNTMIVSGALATAGSTLFAVPASADTLDGCTAGARNPDIRVCQDDPVTDQSNSIHALVKANPLLCVHAVILDGRRVVGTRDCSHPATVVPVVPVVPVEPAPVGGTQPCSCTIPAPGSEGSTAPSEETPGSEGSSMGSTAPSEGLPEAPAPQTVTNETANGPLPAVTH